MAAPVLTSQQREDELLDIEDVLGKRIVGTRLARNVTIREENAIAALEVMGRFACNPKWLVHLPPAVSPSETASDPELLEHPADAFGYYRQAGVPTVFCEGEAHGLADGRGRLPRRKTPLAAASASSTRAAAPASPAPAAVSSTTTSSRGSC